MWNVKVGDRNVCILFISQHCVKCNSWLIVIITLVTVMAIVVAIAPEAATEAAPAIAVVIVLVPYLSLSLVILRMKSLRVPTVLLLLVV